jgi:predicted tellurium resistance membrane protein TerC
MELLTDPQAWIAFATLTALEVVLGIDNVIFISILAGKLPKAQQARARRLGLLAALGSRVLLMLTLAWIARLTAPLFAIAGQEISGRDLVLIAGGLFLIYKATHEIHEKLEGTTNAKGAAVAATFGAVIAQIMIIDMVFSLDSIITAVGMVDEIPIMVAAIFVAIGIMMVFANAIGEFVENHPTIKMLALGFLLLIGMALIAEGVDFHIPKGYIYVAMAFAVFVELLNIRTRRRTAPVQLHEPYAAAGASCPACGRPLEG